MIRQVVTTAGGGSTSNGYIPLSSYSALYGGSTITVVSDKFVVPSDGFYLIAGGVFLNNAGGVCTIEVRVNDVGCAGISHGYGDGWGTVQILEYMQAGSTVGFYAHEGSVGVNNGSYFFIGKVLNSFSDTLGLSDSTFREATADGSAGSGYPMGPSNTKYRTGTSTDMPTDVSVQYLSSNSCIIVSVSYKHNCVGSNNTGIYLRGSTVGNNNTRLGCLRASSVAYDECFLEVFDSQSVSSYIWTTFPSTAGANVYTGYSFGVIKY